VLITCDSIQHHVAPYKASWLAYGVMWWMGFFGRCKPGPGWLTSTGYPKSLSVLDDLQRLRDDYRFETLLSAHGSPCLSEAHYHFGHCLRALLTKHDIEDDFEFSDDEERD
jgi:hypothetical protein